MGHVQVPFIDRPVQHGDFLGNTIKYIMKITLLLKCHCWSQFVFENSLCKLARYFRIINLGTQFNFKSNYQKYEQVLKTLWTNLLLSTVYLDSLSKVQSHSNPVIFIYKKLHKLLKPVIMQLKFSIREWATCFMF